MEQIIACTLSEPVFRERRRMILDFVRNAALAVTPLPQGLACTFRPESEVLAQVARLVDLERQCCPFLRFAILAEAEKPFTLEVTGPPGAQPMIADLFDLPGQ